MSRITAAARIAVTIRALGLRSQSTYTSSSFRPTHLKHKWKNQRLAVMDAKAGSSWSAEDSTRVARPDEVNYALIQDMGKGYQRRSVKISALGTTYNMVYGEWIAPGRSEAECPIVICCHGTPATEGAFRPIGSRIAMNGYRVLAVNFPGMGYTETDAKGRYDHSTVHKVALIKGFISALKLESVAMVIGHSLGSHIVGGLAADPELEGIVQSACFMCGTGVTPHRLWKKVSYPILSHILYKLMYLPIIGWIVTHFLAKIVYRAGFRGRTDEAQALCIYEVAKMRFDLFAQDLMRIAEQRLPVLLLYALDDTVVESELLVDNIDLLGIPDRDIKEYDADGHAEETFHNGTLRRVVRFAKATHRLHFTRPEDTIREIVSLLDALTASK